MEAQMSNGTAASDPRPTLQSIAEYAKKNAPKAKMAGMPMDHAGMESVREADYKGHHITVRTSYKIDVDGTPVTGHLGVTNDGQVHYHPIPNMAFDSAIDLVKRLIDTFPDDFGKPGTAPPASGGKTPDQMGGHAGMNMSASAKPKSAPRKSKGK
jgi:hypothetical protein